VQNTHNSELENLNLQHTNGNSNYQYSHKINENNNLFDIHISKNNDNIDDSILKDFNRGKTDNKNAIKVQDDEDLLQEDRITHNHLKENAYQEENKKDNFENELANIGDKTEINEDENRGAELN